MGLKKITHRKKSGKTTGYLYTFDLIYPEIKAKDAVEEAFDQWVGEQEDGATGYDYRYKTIRG
ncbi:hypothetical protein PsalMR5_04629 (plasmid) [Piscirickettsia salmonis]|uniref:hypothetical protein n=1 Tax=Piscirickettsia salmonis TaxID=1238 RepID=UPI0012BAC7F2|nr:hypothetical protein [Piscirickettsia salmonis]QGP57098.1 hypothetical protein PsalSR1_04587 [Piscirickettsia salmonis]QGP66704.1 hypothetical protein PsalMR5_04629 [Piscirickettsia salmonis]